MDFSSLLGLLPDSALGYLNFGGLVIGGASVFAASISRYTKNKTDDKIAGWLRKAHNIFGFIGLHGATLNTKRVGVALQAADLAETVPPVRPVRDHRTGSTRLVIDARDKGPRDAD